jgi:hypothetical protein
MALVPLTSNFMPLQPCNAKSDLSASRYSTWWAMRRGDLSTDKVRSKSCLEELSVSPRTHLFDHTLASITTLTGCVENIQGAELARDRSDTIMPSPRRLCRDQGSAPATHSRLPGSTQVTGLCSRRGPIAGPRPIPALTRPRTGLAESSTPCRPPVRTCSTWSRPTTAADGPAKSPAPCRPPAA